MSSDHVLVVGIDGVRYDTLMQVATPALDAIADAGFIRPIRVNDAGPTISGPGWSTIFTGVLAPDHGVLNNDFSSSRYEEHPEVVTTARRQRPSIASWVAASWTPLVTSASGGPLFADGGWTPETPAGVSDGWRTADRLLAERTVDFLTEHDGANGSLVVAYLGAPDEVCHALGVGAEYRDTIADSDRLLGTMLAAVRAREGEDWTVIVVTDHGHVDAGGHGGDSEHERTAWIAAYGPDLPTDAPEQLEHADVAAQVLATLGLTAESDSFFGRAFGAR